MLILWQPSWISQKIFRSFKKFKSGYWADKGPKYFRNNDVFGNLTFKSMRLDLFLLQIEFFILNFKEN